MLEEGRIRAAQAKAVGGGRKRCSKGKNCSATCIERSDYCLVELSASPSSAMSQLRNKVESSKQLNLFDVSSVLSKEKLKEYVDKKNREIQKGILEAINKGDDDKYERLREEAIKFNKRLLDSGLADKGDSVKVPLSMERLERVKKSYYNVKNKLENEMTKAASLGDRNKYDNLEKKLMIMQRRVGVKLGIESVRKGDVWAEERRKYKDSEFLQRLFNGKNLKDVEVSYNGYGSLEISKNVRGQKLTLFISKGGKIFSFTVNGDYSADPSLPKAAKFAIIKETRSLFSKVVEEMDEGSVVKVGAYPSDGKGKMREKAYQKFGFEKDGRSMYGMVTGGRLVGSNREEYDDYYTHNYPNFREKA